MASKQVISLIGFPGSGKSTVGVLLAKRLGTDFVDTDILIQNREQATWPRSLPAMTTCICVQWKSRCYSICP